MEKHELEWVTSTYIMSCNVLLHDCTRHTRTLPLLKDLEDSHEANLRGLGSFTEVVTGTQECALGERAWSQYARVFWQILQLGRLQKVL
jgi:hypothetical protein